MIAVGKFLDPYLESLKKHVIPTLKDPLELKANDRFQVSEYKKISTEGW